MLFLPFCSFGQDKQIIVWVENDFPPVWILQGPQKGNGGADLIQKLLIVKLTDYNHKKIKANVSRTEELVRKKENVCSCATFKTPDREEYGYFNTIPSSFILANGIITKKKNRHLFENIQKVSLAHTLKNNNLKLGITQDRKFGDKIDQLIDKHKNSSNIYERTSSDLTKGLIEMLFLDRVDYILGYDWELQYLAKEFWSEKQANELIFISVEETKPYLISYIFCSKSILGKTVVNKIDKILEEEIPKALYRGIWGRWMSNQELYRKMYYEFYLKKIPVAAPYKK